MGAGQPTKRTLGSLFPEQGRILLTGTGKQVLERIGVEAARRIVLSVMMGENIRDQTEPLTRQRITQISGAMVIMFLRGWLEVEHFTDKLSSMAVEQLTSSGKRIQKANISPALWVLGLTKKQMQNVLRDRKERLIPYITGFETVIEQAAAQCPKDYGELRITMGFAKDSEGRTITLGWKDLARLMTAIGSQTLAIRGSDKAMFGKLFEKLILGSVLTTFGFRRVNPAINTSTDKVFWLSDSTGSRESDATLIFRRGQVARFDMGFIGRGNSEISKDKLSRYEREAEAAGGKHSSVTFIIVDRLPTKSKKTQEAANKIGAEIIQMHWQYWPRRLAERLGERLGFVHELQTMPDNKIREYLTNQLADIPIQDFLTAITIGELEEENESKDMD